MHTGSGSTNGDQEKLSNGLCPFASTNLYAANLPARREAGWICNFLTGSQFGYCSLEDHFVLFCAPGASRNLLAFLNPDHRILLTFHPVVD